MIAFSIFNKRGYSFVTVLICLFTAGWYSSILTNHSEDHHDIDVQNESVLDETNYLSSTFLSYINLPIFTLIFVAYVYQDELFDRIGFLLLDKRIKEYKKLRAGVQKLIPEIVRKFTTKKDHNIELSS